MGFYGIKLVQEILYWFKKYCIGSRKIVLVLEILYCQYWFKEIHVLYWFKKYCISSRNIIVLVQERLY